MTEDDPPDVVWLLEEDVVRRLRAPGDRTAVARVLEMPNVTVQVVPRRVAPNSGLGGSFEIVYGPVGVVVCEETRRTNLYYDDAAEVDQYREVFDTLRVVAFDAEQSRMLLREAHSQTSNVNAARRCW